MSVASTSLRRLARCAAPGGGGAVAAPSASVGKQTRGIASSSASKVARSSRLPSALIPERSSSSSQSVAPTPAAAATRLFSSSSQTRIQSPSDTKKAEATLRRFWKTVSLHTTPTHHEVQLDGRSLRTPSGTPLRIPLENTLLASLIVHEWDQQTQLIKSHALPLTSLAARAIDGFAEEAARKEKIEEMLKYAETDTICFHETSPNALVRLQKEHWDPLVQWVASRFGHTPTVATDTLFATQSPELISALSTHLYTLTPLQLSALEKSLHLTKSIFLSLALLEGRLTVEEAMQAAWVETSAQMETWGEVEDSHDVGWAELGRELGAVGMATVAK